MNILVLATGGTIASGVAETGLAPKAENTLKLLRLYQESHPQNKTTFTAKTICNILSENADDDFYEALVSYFAQLSLEAIDGVILLHGTDTLSFTAPLLAMALRGFPKPICLVSSNHILENASANGLANFHAAVRYIESGYSGIVVPYQNHDGNMQYHLATRILEADAHLDDFQSAKHAVLGTLQADAVQLCAFENMPTQEAFKQKKTTYCTKEFSLQNKVCAFKLHPQFCFDAISFKDKNIKAVLFWGYHSGTAPQKALTQFAKRANRQGIEVYLSPLKKSELQYESTNALLAANIQPIFAMTNEAALAKLKLAYNQNKQTTKAFLKENLYFEEI